MKKTFNDFIVLDINYLLVNTSININIKLVLFTEALLFEAILNRTSLIFKEGTKNVYGGNA